jgi:outer membrane lipoprotein-sorting protein
MGPADFARWALVLWAVSACARPAPPSRFPSADDAIRRMRATYACSRGVTGEAKVDYFGEQGRVRGSALFVVARPDKVRFDVFSPFGATVSTLTTDGKHFALLDFGTKQFFVGPAAECNVTRFLHVPVPPYALVDLLTGQAPVLVHTAPDAELSWSSGAYVVRIRSIHDATEEIRLEPTPDDWGRPWNEQRLRVLGVRVVQKGVELYDAELGDFRVAHTAPPRVDAEGIEPDIPPSGPPCAVEVPRHVHIVSEASGQDVILVHKEIAENPPLERGLFEQSAPAGTRLRAALCQ